VHEKPLKIPSVPSGLSVRSSAGRRWPCRGVRGTSQTSTGRTGWDRSTWPLRGGAATLLSRSRSARSAARKPPSCAASRARSTSAGPTGPARGSKRSSGWACGTIPTRRAATPAPAAGRHHGPWL